MYSSPLQDVEELIRIALHRYSADRIAKFDFALENSGGSVLKNSESYPPSLETFSVMGVPVWSVPCSPTAIIRVSLFPHSSLPSPFSLLSLPLSSSSLPPSLPLFFYSLLFYMTTLFFSLVYILVTAGQ